MGKRLIWGLAIAATYLAAALICLPPLGIGIDPDTFSHLEFEPYRQPLYGIWANAVHAYSGSWHTVQIVQVGLFVVFSAWVIVELSLISNLGIVAAVLFAAMQLVFIRLPGLLYPLSSLLSEGIFYPMILGMVAMFLAWLRAGGTTLLTALALLIVAMTQVRAAALLVLVVLLLAASCALLRQFWRPTGDRSSIWVIGATIAGLVFMPPLLGKSTLQVSTQSDFTGFVLLPRISLLPVPQDVAERSPSWVAMSFSWRAAASDLDAAALTQFDAVLQEAIRFHLGPKILMPAILKRSPEDIQHSLSGKYYEQDATYYQHAKRIAIEWIFAEWLTYLQLSGKHLWGMLTMANYMDEADRKQVWKALHEVSDATWRVAPFRTNYPLAHIDTPMTWKTNVLHLLIRYVSIFVLCLGALSAATLLAQLRGNREVSPGCLAVVLAVGWSIAHSIPFALTVFPLLRYTYPNFLVMFSGAAAWLAFAGRGVSESY